MKITSYLFFFILITSVILAGCKKKTPQELIINKWKLKELSGDNAALIPDSVKTKLLDNSTMEFKADNTFILTGMEPEPQQGTFAISTDGKRLTLIPYKTKKVEVDTINELSGTKLVITDKLGNKLTSTN